MSLQQIADLLDQIVRERGEDANAGRAWMPEAVALATIARRALEGACATLVTSRNGTVIKLRRAASIMASDVLQLRDQLDEALRDEALIRASSTPPNAQNTSVTVLPKTPQANRPKRGDDARQRPQLRTKKPSPVDAFSIGQLVDVEYHDTKYIGRVIKKNTRLHVEHLDAKPGDGHMAFEAADIRRGVVKARVRL